MKAHKSLSTGTWQAAPGEVAEGVYHALKSGYRLLDCAYCYGNEAEVGQGLARAIKEGIVKREDVFVVTKVWYVVEPTLTAFPTDSYFSFQFLTNTRPQDNLQHPRVPRPLQVPRCPGS